MAKDVMGQAVVDALALEAKIARELGPLVQQLLLVRSGQRARRDLPRGIVLEQEIGRLKQAAENARKARQGAERLLAALEANGFAPKGVK